ncbi:MAG: thioredoxin family protein [Oscillatoriales cyanobacterium]|uniref:Thylakoid membrane photosystem I accumulation factor n=1 Tax=Microcoleus anatoxicus PTRS2 TaxID=2705321 RepID=A0ABU8YIG7_9CYAN|nr:MAG: thioredoxin family protein [Oscillatoriales cyanobacterium]TAD98273.1 MAG: thioredoxin family protein [Oscillatoriales cyanobacterium]TAE06087.1 MAG: thioredoxin family protein [Oscillatoriales cyanobacterium]TAF05434.1 MAG: thioredoxin family protein [Oscillatoriales cyanobacterium]TAF38311.1 MAG: thioredoxin family protein [Oscillatoriales cyanobacterium]
MIFSKYQNLIATIISGKRLLRRILSASLLTVAIALSFILFISPAPAYATLTDDRFDGTIFALYGGNGSLVPPKVTLKDSFKRKKPVLLVFYTDDSSDSKQYAIVVSNLQEFYGRAADFIPVSIDSLPAKPAPELTNPSHYYEGFVPQTVILDQSGKIVFNAKGQVPFEEVDDAFRKVFDLLPRDKSLPLKRRVVNELNTELSK